MNRSEPPAFDTAQRLPSSRLCPYVARYGGFRAESTPPRTRGLPSRHVTLMIGLGTSFQVVGAGSFQSFIGGLHDGPAIIEGGGRIEGLHVVLKPLGIRALLGVPAAALAGGVFRLDEILGAAAAFELQDRLHQARFWPERFDVLDQVLAHGLRPDTDRLAPESATPELSWACRSIIGQAGGASIDEVAREIGWSRRQLTGRFGAELGIAPKTLARIVRFERACALIRRRGGSLVDIAAAAGYYDQPHMTREWLALAGCTPGAWIREELPYLQDYELAGLEATHGASRAPRLR
jgi:AraC-like DNA-binding protein